MVRKLSEAAERQESFIYEGVRFMRNLKKKKCTLGSNFIWNFVSTTVLLRKKKKKYRKLYLKRMKEFKGKTYLVGRGP